MRCARATPWLMCPSRRHAQRDGTIYYAVHLRGWVYPADQRSIPRVSRDRGVPPFTWRFCPFCGGDLPDDVTAVERALEEPPVWGEEGD